MSSIPLFLSNEHSCGYLDERIAQSTFVHPSFPLNMSIYSFLLEHGFRRSGNHVYSPHCQTCSACIPVRIAVADFRPSRIHKRTVAKNMTTSVDIKPATFEPHHFAMYQRYQNARHKDGNMAESTREEYMNFLTSDWSDTLFVEFKINHEPAAVAVVDQLKNALSAVYTFFEPKFSNYSLGVYAILWQIQHAQQQQRQWLYLGYWIEDCQKMSYKTQYRPIQLYINKQWQVE